MNCIIVKKICEHCNNEFTVENTYPPKDEFIATMPICSHCNKTNNLWIKITKRW